MKNLSGIMMLRLKVILIIQEYWKEEGHTLLILQLCLILHQ